MSAVNVKWGKTKLENVEIDLGQDVLTLKSVLFSMTHVPVDKLKLMAKGKVLRDDQILSDAGIKSGQLLMMTGSAEEYVEQVERPVFPEEMTPEERAKLYKEKIGAPLPNGLNNLGNTCYMNSVVQSLGRVTELREALIQHQPNMSDPQSVYSASVGRTYQSMTAVMEPFTPYEILGQIRNLNPMFGETDERGAGRQQDAEECFSFILNTMRQPVKMIDSDGAEVSLVDHLFNIDLRTEFKCVETEEEPPSVGFESSLRLQCLVDNAEQPISHLHEGLTQGLVGQVEKFSEFLGRNAIYTKTTQINKLPGYLAISFSRFQWKQANALSGTKDTRVKILRKVTFPQNLDVYQFCSDELKQSLDVGREMEKEMRERELNEESKGEENAVPKEEPLGTGLDTGAYELVAIVTHQGRSADSGHYVGWVKLADEEWAKLDDDRVSSATQAEVLDLNGGGDWHMAYINIYRKKELIPK